MLSHFGAGVSVVEFEVAQSLAGPCERGVDIREVERRIELHGLGHGRVSLVKLRAQSGWISIATARYLRRLGSE